MGRKSLCVLVSALCMTMGLSRLHAADIAGIVLDESGASVPDAHITVTNIESGIQRRTASNDSGSYFVSFLKPGSYRLTVRHEGFMAVTYSELRLKVGQVLRLDVVLTVARVMATVRVNTDFTSDRASAELGTVIGRKAIESLPLNGRNFTSLLLLAAGVTPVSTSQGSRIGPGDGEVTGIPGTDYLKPSFHGQQNRSQVSYMDGIINTDFRSNSYAVLPNIDVLDEFKVQAHDTRAEWGGTTGGIINLMSKSGTNELHGSGFWFLRNDVFDARDPFKDGARNSPAPFRQNQFGATVGGPLLRNRTFYHLGYDGWRYRKPTQSFARVPTAKELSGDFSNSIIGTDIYDPSTTRFDARGDLVRDPFPGNLIPASMLSPMVQGFLRIYEEVPNYDDPVYNFINNVSSKDNANSFQIKLDHRLTDGDSLFFRWSRQHRRPVLPTGQKRTTTTEMVADNYGGAWLHTLSGNAILNLRGGVAARNFRMALQQHVAGLGAMRRLGFSDVDRFGGLLMGLTSPWRADIGMRGVAPRKNPTYSIAADLSWTRQNHILKTGLQWIGVERLQANTYQQFYFDDKVTADPLQPGKSGASLASALLGYPVRFEGELPGQSEISFGLQTWSAYFQDEWRAGRALTVSYGLRFDHNMRPDIHHGLEAGPDLDRAVWLIGAEQMPPPCNQTGKAPCIPGNGLEDVPHGDRIVLANPPNFVPMEIWDNWGPRIGVAYRASARTVVRAGYGLHWDTLISNSQYTQHNVNQWPMTKGFRGTANALGEEMTPIEGLQGKFPAVLPEPSPWKRQGWANDPDRKNAYSHQWNVEIQRQMTDNLTASVAYVGSLNRRLDYSGLGNSALRPGPGTPDQVDQRRPVPFMSGGLFYSRSIGRSNYNALEVNLRRKFSDGLQFMVSYSWSKSIDTGSSGWFAAENGPGGSAANQNYHDLNADRSVSSYNIPHFLSCYLVYELPLGGGRSKLTSGPASWLLGNWQLSSIFQWRSGQPYNLAVPGDVANIGNDRAGWNYARPNLIGNPIPDNPTAEQYFRTDAFAIPQFEYGNFGRNVLSSDDVLRLDLSLAKVFPLGRDGSKRLELRFEAFNVLNHIDWAPPGTLIGQPGAGRVTGVAAPPRIIQVGSRLVF